MGHRTSGVFGYAKSQFKGNVTLVFDDHFGELSNQTMFDVTHTKLLRLPLALL